MQPRDPAETVANQSHAPVYRIDDLIVDTGRVTVVRADQELTLPKLSFDMLVALIEAAPRVASPDELMDRVWPGLVVSPETVSQRIMLLRDSLGDDSKSPHYVAGVRGRGYRLLPDVVRQDGAESIVAASAAEAPAAAGTRWPWVLAALAVAIAAAAITWLLVDRERKAAPAEETATTATPSARSVAVLAFEDRGGADGTDILAEGIPETVLHQLARMPGLTVIARGSSFAFREQPEDLRVIGRKLNVRYLLEGSVQSAGPRLRVTSSLVDAETGASVWSMQFDRAPQDVFAMQDEIAIEVARAMQVTLEAGTGAAASLQQGATTSYDAYFSFLRGRALLASLRVGELPAAIEALTTAIRLDPSFAAAYVQLARARVALAEQDTARQAQQNFPQALESAVRLLEKAISLDPENGEAYVERGQLKMFFDLAGADRDLRRGLELAPNYARGYEGLAAVLFQSVARRREALEMIEKARRLDPLAPHLDVLKATYLFWGTGATAQAAQLLETVLERDPLYVPAMVRLAEVRWAGQGENAEAAALSEQAVALDPQNETAWQMLVTSYLEMDEPAAAESAIPHLAHEPDYGWLLLRLYWKDWQRAGDAAYAMIEAGQTNPKIESQIALAIRRHARETGNYRRAIGALEDWAAVSWDGHEPLLQGQLDTGVGVAGLADLLMASGRQTEATALLEELLADIDVQVGRYGRGEIWMNDARAIAFALLGRPDEAMAARQRQARLGFQRHNWRIVLENEPAFDSLRGRKDFQALLADVRANAASQREKLRRMRKDGLVPDRGPAKP